METYDGISGFIKRGRERDLSAAVKSPRACSRLPGEEQERALALSLSLSLSLSHTHTHTHTHTHILILNPISRMNLFSFLSKFGLYIS